MQFIENKEIKIMFDEDNAIKNLIRYEESHQAEKKRAKIHNKKFTRKLIALAIVGFTIVFGIAYFICKRFEGVSLGEGFTSAFYVVTIWFFLFVGFVFLLMYLISKGYKDVKDIEHSYDNNLWFYLMQKDKNVIDIKITDCEGGKYCELSLITLAPENYVITELYQKNLDNRIVKHDCHILLRKVLKKDIDKITVDIPNGEVQYPYTEPLERLVVSNG